MDRLARIEKSEFECVRTQRASASAVLQFAGDRPRAALFTRPWRCDTLGPVVVERAIAQDLESRPYAKLQHCCAQAHLSVFAPSCERFRFGQILTEAMSAGLAIVCSARSPIDNLGASSTKTITVNVTAQPPSDDFANMTSTTGSISVGGTADGNIETINDTDWFKITLTAGRPSAIALSKARNSVTPPPLCTFGA